MKQNNYTELSGLLFSQKFRMEMAPQTPRPQIHNLSAVSLILYKKITMFYRECGHREYKGNALRAGDARMCLGSHVGAEPQCDIFPTRAHSHHSFKNRSLALEINLS